MEAQAPGETSKAACDLFCVHQLFHNLKKMALICDTVSRDGNELTLGTDWE